MWDFEVLITQHCIMIVFYAVYFLIFSPSFFSWLLFFFFT